MTGTALRVDIGDVELAYDEHGPADAPAVVFLHGLSGARTHWDEIVAALPGLRLIVVDQRGHGESARAPSPDGYCVEHYTADAARLVERVLGGPSVVVGHSLGGLVAAHLASTRPDLVRATFLEDPPLYFGDRPTYQASMFAAFFPLAMQLLRSFRDQGFTEEQVYEAIRGLPDVSGAGTMEAVQGRAAVETQARIWHRFDPEAYASAIDGSLFAAYDPTAALACPVHVLRAERDLAAAFYPEHADAFVATNPAATVDLVPGASHLIHTEQPDVFVSALRPFLERHAT